MNRKEIAKRPVHATFDEAGPDDASAVSFQHSNSETVIDAIINEVDRDLSEAGNNFDGLRAHSRAGQRLNELKTHLDHGQFDRVVKDRLGITRQWRARLMKLGREWPNIVAAIESAKANNRLTRAAYSVDGALALLADWRREAANDGNNFGPTGKKFFADSFTRKQTINKGELIEYLRQFLMVLLLELLRARRRIAFLESEIERLTGAAHADAPCAEQFMLPLPEHYEIQGIARKG